MKNIAILGAISTDDLKPSPTAEGWNITLSYLNHFKKLNFNAKIYNTLVNDKWNDLNLQLLVKEYKENIFVPDIVFHLDFGFFQSEFLNKKYIPTAKWIAESGDDPQNFRLNYSKLSKGNFDLILSPDFRTTQKYTENNFKAAWFPHFADSDLYADLQQEPIYDCVTTRHYSEPFFLKLKNILGDSFHPRTEDFFVGKDHTRHLKKGKIVVQNSKYKEITRRVFEGMMANRLVITDRPDPGTRMDLIFVENKHIVYFDSIDDCVDKIKYYLANEPERLSISQNGYNHVSKNHTTLARVTKLLELIL
jgi:hypothetical protein